MDQIVMDCWMQTDRSAVRRQLIDQGLPLHFTPLTGYSDVQLLLINRDRQGQQVRPDLVQGVEQRQGSLQLFGIRHRLFVKKLKFQPLLDGIFSGRNGPAPGVIAGSTSDRGAGFRSLCEVRVALQHD